jgi:HD superfamily phosphohydrolase YqeK
VMERVFSGRFTKHRRKVLEKSVRLFNNNRSHPYGTSPNGYAYTCGCEHDCCGCLSSESAMLSIDHHRFLKITIIQTFNF